MGRSATTIAASSTGGVLRRLGNFTVERFLREYWQRRPVLVRKALPDHRIRTDRAVLFGFAAGNDVESRLVVRRGTRWAVKHGPFARHALPPLKQPGWTLLLQGLDLLDDGAHRLLSTFRFLPDARLDDLMASYATHGGGVGPHSDSYDVFLLQAQGRRLWRISSQRNLPLQSAQPLKLLAGFRPSREWLLEPGDMLYLPPGVPHEGVAQGDSITYSIGFRSPAYQELLDPWFARYAETVAIPGRYADAGRGKTRHPAELPHDFPARVHEALSSIRPDRAWTARFLLEHLSEPKPHVVFDRPCRALSAAKFADALMLRGAVLDRRSRMLSSRGLIAINGEILPVARSANALMRRLADRRGLLPAEAARAPEKMRATLYEWYLAGWLRLATSDER